MCYFPITAFRTHKLFFKVLILIVEAKIIQLLEMEIWLKGAANISTVIIYVCYVFKIIWLLIISKSIKYIRYGMRNKIKWKINSYAIWLWMVLIPWFIICFDLMSLFECIVHNDKKNKQNIILINSMHIQQDGKVSPP